MDIKRTFTLIRLNRLNNRFAHLALDCNTMRGRMHTALEMAIKAETVGEKKFLIKVVQLEDKKWGKMISEMKKLNAKMKKLEATL